MPYCRRELIEAVCLESRFYSSGLHIRNHHGPCNHNTLKVVTLIPTNKETCRVPPQPGNEDEIVPQALLRTLPLLQTVDLSGGRQLWRASEGFTACLWLLLFGLCTQRDPPEKVIVEWY